jgi:hypothetical protein
MRPRCPSHWSPLWWRGDQSKHNLPKLTNPMVTCPSYRIPLWWGPRMCARDRPRVYTHVCTHTHTHSHTVHSRPMTVCGWSKSKSRQGWSSSKSKRGNRRTWVVWGVWEVVYELHAVVYLSYKPEWTRQQQPQACPLCCCLGLCICICFYFCSILCLGSRLSMTPQVSCEVRIYWGGMLTLRSNCKWCNLSCSFEVRLLTTTLIQVTVRLHRLQIKLQEV